MIIEYSDKIYPEKLRQIKKPPSRLYVLGNIEILNKNGIAVVGSRTNTQYGEKMCKTFVKNLVEYDFNIISGLAVGIDSIAHKTCLKNSGKTIAVLPCGFNYIYPEVNIPLAQEILKNGGTLVSEYDENTKPDSKKFKERNRIVAGLGIGTLIIEAGNRSGTSITARHTIEQGKPVFSIPSNLDNKKGKITNELIRNGAYLVRNVEDIINTYDINFTKRKSKIKDIYLDIPEELIDVYKVINDIPKDINKIANETNLNISDVNYKTMLLVMENKIIELPGQRFVRNDEQYE